MIRLTGAVLLLLGGLALGLIPVWELSRRAAALRAWGDALLLLKGELSFALPAMPQLLETLSHKALSPAGETFAQVGRGLGALGERSFDQIWTQAVTQYGGLQGEDLAPLLRLGETLGRYGREDRDRVLEAVLEQLSRREEHCREELKNKGRAYGALGLSLGAFFIIFLL